MRKSLLFITGLLCLCLLTACGTKAEVPPETPPVVETAAPSPTPPMSEEPFAPVSGDEIAKELAEAIRQLRSEGICVAAIFWGGDYAVPSLRRIYGDSFIRIKQIQQFPDAVSGLLMRLLDQMHEQ